ncbi:hypothetical protein VTK26DRAFT_8061 [Humicola hyalothermophila]
MSNTAVGPIYEAIIQEVINAVRVDFEENGVDDGVLEDLKKRWQLKLSQQNVAQFPWDPKPEPQPAPAASAAPPNAAPMNAPPPNAAAHYTQSTLSPQNPAQSLSLPGTHLPNPNGPAIKQEPDLAPTETIPKQEPGFQPMHHGYNAAHAARGTAAQRAAQALENQYGQRAAASINAIHSGIASQMNPAVQAHQAPRQGQPQQHMNLQQQYRQGVAASIQQRMQQVSHSGQPNGLPSAQVDGAAETAEATSSSEQLRAQLAERARQMEGGGLMLPLSKIPSRPGLSSQEQRTAGPAQVDGPDDDVKEEDSDEDAINSDLDDPDEDRDDEDEDDDSMNMMLCMYDKVQRVKNKWKCILKDGVLTVNGKEYVFHKATGEYEW